MMGIFTLEIFRMWNRKAKVKVVLNRFKCWINLSYQALKEEFDANANMYPYIVE
jgi:hypothetical protein